MKVQGLQQESSPNLFALKRKSSITGRVLRTLLFRFSLKCSRNRVWGRERPRKFFKKDRNDGGEFIASELSVTPLG